LNYGVHGMSKMIPYFPYKLMLVFGNLKNKKKKKNLLKEYSMLWVEHFTIYFIS